MKCIVSILFFLIIFPNLAAASKVTIRTAEHDGFTRLAIDSVAPSEIKIVDSKNGFIVALPDSTTAIDDSDFFRRISRDRIKEYRLDNSKNEIEVLLICDCRKTTFLSGKTTYVIDLSENAEATAVVPNNLNSKPTFIPRASREALSFSLNHEKQERVSEMPSVRDAQIGESLEAAITSDRTIAARENVIEALSRNFDVKRANVQSSEQVANLPALGEQIVYRSLPNLQENALVEIEENARFIAQVCMGINELNPENWPNYGNAGEFLSAVHTEFSENIEENEQAAIKNLGLSYLSLGMGAEAKIVLEMLTAPNDNERQLVLLSKIIEEPITLKTVRLSEEISKCEQTLIWDLLSGASDLDREPLDEKQLILVRSQFENWPSALKGLFAPALAQELLHRGESEVAKFAMRKSQSLPSSRSGEREIAEARILEDAGSTKEAVKLLQPIVDNDLETGPEAAISLVKLASEQGESARNSNSVALESYQSELKGTDVEPDLLRARITTAMQTGDFEEAVTLVEDIAKMVRVSRLNLVLDELGGAILRVESDAEFLKEAVSLPAKFFNAISVDTKEKIKERVVALGFSDLADQLGKYAARNRQSNSSEVTIQPDVVDAVTAESSSATESQQQPAGARVNDSVTSETGDASLETETPENRDQSPLASAIGETRAILQSLTDLEEDIARLGL